MDDAIRTRKFLVITSLDIKFLYFLKRHFPMFFHLIMLLLTRIMDKSSAKVERCFVYDRKILPLDIDMIGKMFG